MPLWFFWAVITRYPSRWKLMVAVVGGALALLLEIYNLPPYKGLEDAHALWYATKIPVTYLSWSFIKSYAEYRTLVQTKKSK